SRRRRVFERVEAGMGGRGQGGGRGGGGNRTLSGGGKGPPRSGAGSTPPRQGPPERAAGGGGGRGGGGAGGPGAPPPTSPSSPPNSCIATSLRTIHASSLRGNRRMSSLRHASASSSVAKRSCKARSLTSFDAPNSRNASLACSGVTGSPRRMAVMI